MRHLVLLGFATESAALSHASGPAWMTSTACGSPRGEDLADRGHLLGLGLALDLVVSSLKIVFSEPGLPWSW